jgi:hypothetical protein
VRDGRIQTVHGHKKFRGAREQARRAPAQGTLQAGGSGKFRSAGHSPGRKADCPLPQMRLEWQKKVVRSRRQAKPKPTRPAQGSKADFGSKPEPEPQGQAATPAKKARRNTPCRSGRERMRHARRRPPALGPGRASRPATGCKQWPASFSRFEYQPVSRNKLNGFCLLHVNFWPCVHIPLNTCVPPRWP